jgi:hypothetical protein
MDGAYNGDNLQDDDPVCPRRPQTISQPKGEVMKNQVPKYVTQARASFLLGLTLAELTRISRESGLGRVERAGSEEETYFTYEELERICILAAQQTQTVH